MKSPGTLLREGREARELSLDDVATMTRIPRTMLEHLEKDRFEEYVAEVFLRGHIRNYAREIHLDVEQVLQAYERHTGRARVNPLAEVERQGRRVQAPAGRAKAATLNRSRIGSNSEATSARISGYFGGLRRSHLVAILLVVVGLFMMFSYLTNNRATAQDPVDFPEADESAWEQDVEETRWLLEQTDD